MSLGDFGLGSFGVGVFGPFSPGTEEASGFGEALSSAFEFPGFPEGFVFDATQFGLTIEQQIAL